jgi:hypothetical protein
MHPVEATWRRFRNSDERLWLTRCLEARKTYLDFIHLKSCPPEVVLPGAVAWNLVALAEARVRGERTGKSVSTQGSMLVNTVHTWAAYRQSKTIYQIEPALADCLARSPWPAETPTEALRLPSLCPVLAIPREDRRINHVAATLDLLTGAEDSRAFELRLSLLTVDGNRWLPISLLHLARPTLTECVDAAAAEARAHGAPEPLAAMWRNDLSGLALTILLYIAGEPDLVRIVHPGARPPKESIRRRDPERFRDLAEPTIHAAGKAFARAIEHWEIEHRGDPGLNTGRTVRPHLRRAHSHLYWTGEGRQQPRVRFLLPISVRGGRLVEEPTRPREINVR